MKVRRNLFILLVAVVATQPVLATATQESTATTERMAISWLGTNLGGELLERDSPVELYLEEMFDVDLEPWGYEITHSPEDAWRVRIASGDIPDFNVRWREDLVRVGANREVPEERVAGGEGEALQLPELGVHRAEHLRIIEVEVVRRKTGISDHRGCILFID